MTEDIDQPTEEQSPAKVMQLFTGVPESAPIDSHVAQKIQSQPAPAAPSPKGGISTKELLKLIDMSELDSLLFAIDWSGMDKVKKQGRRIFKKYLAHELAPNIMPAIFTYLIFNTQRYDRIIDLHKMLQTEKEVAYGILMNVKYVCMILQGKSEVEGLMYQLPPRTKEFVYKMASDVKESWKSRGKDHKPPYELKKRKPRKS